MFSYFQCLKRSKISSFVYLYLKSALMVYQKDRGELKTLVRNFKLITLGKSLDRKRNEGQGWQTMESWRKSSTKEVCSSEVCAWVKCISLLQVTNYFGREITAYQEFQCKNHKVQEIRQIPFALQLFSFIGFLLYTHINPLLKIEKKRCKYNLKCKHHT